MSDQNLAARRQDEHRCNLKKLTKNCGAWQWVSLYLDRCQVDTPVDVVRATWAHANEKRAKIDKVVDFGAGDCRFAKFGNYRKYIGYEIDIERFDGAKLPKNATLKNLCAFSEIVDDADLCIGNPPFVRNQDLPTGWRQHTTSILADRTGVELSGLANAWQYFLLLSLASTKTDGLSALVIPFEWVSRPSVGKLRDYIRANGWNVSVYRLVDETFKSVLTTASITLIDKSNKDGVRQFFEETKTGKYKKLVSPSGDKMGVLTYQNWSQGDRSLPRVKRGLSPGTQKVLTFTEGERMRYSLKVDRDVVPCVTSLRYFPDNIGCITKSSFNIHYRNQNQKCWLLRTDKRLSKSLKAYLDAVPKTDYQTSTCLERDEWWKFVMPPIPKLLVSMSFRSNFPKLVKNLYNVIPVGGVYGIHNISRSAASDLQKALNEIDIGGRIVSHSNGLKKLEVNQGARLEYAFGESDDGLTVKESALKRRVGRRTEKLSEARLVAEALKAFVAQIEDAPEDKTGIPYFDE